MNILLLQLHLSYNEAVPVDGNVFGFVSYFDVETDIVRLPPKEFALARSHAKRQPCHFQSGYYGVWCFAMCS
jgi:hypothetical protein